MSVNAEQITKLENMLSPLLGESTFLVSLKIKPVNNIKVYLDDDKGIDIEKCIQVNRALYKKIEEAAMYEDGNFSLEVSSPGLTEPLAMNRQYIKNIGRGLEVVLKDDEKTVEGTLTDANEEGIVLEVTSGKGKKAVTESKAISFADIKQAKVIIKI